MASPTSEPTSPRIRSPQVEDSERPRINRLLSLKYNQRYISVRTSTFVILGSVQVSDRVCKNRSVQAKGVVLNYTLSDGNQSQNTRANVLSSSLDVYSIYDLSSWLN